MILKNKIDDNIININNSCSICLEEAVENENICETNCSHFFCQTCLDEWFNRGQISCPICRDSINYFKNMETNYRVIIRSNINNDRNIISRNEINQLLRSYYNMRYISFVMFLLCIFLMNYYRIIKDQYNQLLINNQNNIQNISLLTNELKQCNIISDELITVSIYNGGNNLKRCEIPYLSYIRCFMN